MFYEIEIKFLKEIDAVVNQANAFPNTKAFYNFTSPEWEKGFYELLEKHGAVSTGKLWKRLSPSEQGSLADKINAEFKKNEDERRLVLRGNSNFAFDNAFDNASDNSKQQHVSFWSFETDFLSFTDYKSFELIADDLGHVANCGFGRLTTSFN